MNRMQPPEGPHAPSAHPVYENSWRPSYHPPSFDSHPETRRLSAPTQGPPHLQTYPGPPAVIPNRDLPLPPDGPYGRPNSLPGPSHPPPEPSPVHTSFRPPINGSPHEASPQSATPDYRPRMPYPPSEPPVSNEGTPPVQGHLPPTSQYMQAPPIPAGATPISYDAYFNQAPGTRQRKANRATQACDQCRARKAKCDEGRPSCSHCKENSLGCVYKEVPHHKQEKGTQAVIDKMEGIQDTNINYFDKLVQLTRGTDTQMARMNHVPEQLAALNRVPEQLATLVRMVATLLPPQEAMAALQCLAPQPLKVEPQAMKMQPDTPDAAAGYSHQSTASAAMPAEIDESMKKDDNEGELSIPVEHTTAAHKLLMWPSIKQLMAPKEYDEDYVMRLEEERGLISVRGQGENSFSADGTRLPTYSNGLDRSFGTDKSHRSDENDYYTPKEELMSEEEFIPEITNTGLLHLDAATAERYCSVFLERMHRLHPFLDYTEIRLQLKDFIHYYCPPSSTPRPSTLCQENQRGAKRKRSYDEPQGIRGAPVDSGSSRMRVGMNIENARILLILALGAICECPDPLPGPILDEDIDHLSQYIPGPLPPLPPQPPSNTNGAFGVLSPPNSDIAVPPMYNPISSASQSFSSLPPMGVTSKNLSRRSISKVRDEYGHVKNLQVIPGLSLYGYATSILGHLQGGVELEHVQAGLLAGLYAGQLAHPFQSHGWICQAARACQVLVRQRRYERIEEGPVKDMFNFAYWTCLQLESDLLAELDIPASGISRSEGRIGLPKGRYTIDLPDNMSAMNTRMMLFYSAQIHLRKVLNRVHTDLYKVEKPSAKELAEKKENRWSSNVQIALSMNLDLWRDSLPDIMKWKDSDPPASEINAARMRAKYYGARYIIHRPLLYHALHFGHEGVSKTKNGTTVNSPNNAAKSQQMSPLVSQSSARATTMSRMASDLGSTPTTAKYPDFPNGWTPPTISLRDMPSKLRHACKVCVESAIQSTIAFDGIEDRLVVTNIFGTAHAQFGNMLVLSATYMSCLSELVERPTLERLLRRTIKFLLRSKNISPTLRADARILTEIYERIFGQNTLSV